MRPFARPLMRMLVVGTRLERATERIAARAGSSSAMTTYPCAAVLAAALLTSSLLSSCSASPRAGAARHGVPDSIGYAVVTETEATFAFPGAEVTEGRWPAAVGVKFPQGYSWEVWTHGYPLPVVISHLVMTDSAQRMPAFGSLAEVLKSGELRECRQDHWWFCAYDVAGQMR